MNTLKSEALNIIESMKYNKESIYTWWKDSEWKSKVELSEILANFGDWINTIDALEILKKSNTTLNLLNKIFWFAFHEIKTTNNSFSINAFLKDLWSPELISNIEKLETEYNIDPNKLVIEILEYSYWILDKNTLENIKILKEKWYKFAIDDYAINEIDNPDDLSVENLTILMTNWIIPEYVKIDWWFLQKIFNNDVSKTQVQVLKYMIKILKQKWIKIIWEWIWSKEEAYKARSLWIELFQWKYLENDFSIEQEKVNNFRVAHDIPSFKLHRPQKANNILSPEEIEIQNSNLVKSILNAA